MADARGVGRGGRRRKKVAPTEEDNGDVGAVELIKTLTAKRQTKRVTTVAVPASGGLVQEALTAQGSPTGTFGQGRTSHISPVDEEDRTRNDSRPPDSPQASISTRIKEAAEHVVDTLTSAVAPAAQAVTRSQLAWTLGTLIPALLLTGWICLRYAQPYVAQHQLNSLVSNIEEADKQYQQLLKQLEDTRHLQEFTESRVESALQKLQELEREWAGLDALKRPKVTDDTAAKLEGLSLEIVRRAEEKLQPHLQQTLSTFSADRTGRPDYALHSSGGKVVAHSPLFRTTGGPWYYQLQRLMTDWVPALPGAVHPKANQWLLSPGASAGECLSLNGTMGWVDVRLRTAINADSLTLEHIPESISFEPRSAPRKCTVWGWVAKEVRLHHGQVEHTHASPRRRLGEFVFDLKKGPVQTFPLANDIPVDHIRLQIDSNHGQPLYTCVYRLRVHGHPVEPPEYDKASKTA